MSIWSGTIIISGQSMRASVYRVIPEIGMEDWGGTLYTDTDLGPGVYDTEIGSIIIGNVSIDGKCTFKGAGKFLGE